MKRITLKNTCGYIKSTLYVCDSIPNHETAQCGVNYYADNKNKVMTRRLSRYIDLISYHSVIFTYDKYTDSFIFNRDCISAYDGYKTDCVDCSKQTAKHVEWFCNAFCPHHSYEELKSLYYGK